MLNATWIPLEVVIDAQKWLVSCHQQGLKHQPIQMPFPTISAVFQGDSRKQVIYLRIRQQEKLRSRTQVKVVSLETPRQTNKPS